MTFWLEHNSRERCRFRDYHIFFGVNKYKMAAHVPLGHMSWAIRDESVGYDSKYPVHPTDGMLNINLSFTWMFYHSEMLFHYIEAFLHSRPLDLFETKRWEFFLSASLIRELHLQCLLWTQFAANFKGRLWKERCCDIYHASEYRKFAICSRCCSNILPSGIWLLCLNDQLLRHLPSHNPCTRTLH